MTNTRYIYLFDYNGLLTMVTHNGIPAWLPILSTIGPLTHKLAKNFMELLRLLLANKYAVTDSFHLAGEIFKHDPNLYIASLLINSLIKSIPDSSPTQNQKLLF